jgi:hypothetical protein
MQNADAKTMDAPKDVKSVAIVIEPAWIPAKASGGSIAQIWLPNKKQVILRILWRTVGGKAAVSIRQCIGGTDARPLSAER